MNKVIKLILSERQVEEIYHTDFFAVWEMLTTL